MYLNFWQMNSLNTGTLAFKQTSTLSAEVHTISLGVSTCIDCVIIKVAAHYFRQNG